VLLTACDTEPLAEVDAAIPQAHDSKRITGHFGLEIQQG